MTVIVNGKLYVDDEAYWEGLLEEGGEYQVAYGTSHPLPPKQHPPYVLYLTTQCAAPSKKQA
jgi:hypothetical protein